MFPTRRLFNSSQPQHLATDVDPTKLSSYKNIQQASSQVNRMARRDPGLYPLAFIMVAVATVTGYFLMSKTTEPEEGRRMLARGMVNPWDDVNKQELGAGQVAAFKYRYRTRDGHMEDGYPTINVDVRKVKGDTEHKYHTG
ncbi:hypothetical protein CcaverHIS002_0206500 [Cutaneotrichosporon cavernicola]|uniref:Uncharacterized protein n=1 Tax=Cutaneotrichosporon cavernicola TaxID=279322 RepID=A0AA48L016_9TREE|nr:uncharacterized protein CcaverHIS019_0206480 [Cutaneotrichosporon cavernicola]BEI81490.1 hypothetical protein CcaverHIS002_0206500 [Cutaneotrichosporon cavernicola]BEI89286.1 hypothetical protein CcaverHIS019_0206480 [Cutaneotrichosporon cavernicola]BEI97062.1 hypothetical protein CcaverHIS631_0206510 [Cutaneotrichosporon cavernicola]BEJ04835.1 hypothetical protein CcaverHIS641_0206520 [Cutaneotrichosporon cavernicola]